MPSEESLGRCDQCWTPIDVQNMRMLVSPPLPSCVVPSKLVAWPCERPTATQHRALQGCSCGKRARVKTSATGCARVWVVISCSSAWPLGQLRMCRSRVAKETASPTVLSSDRISSGCREKPARPSQPVSWKMLVCVLSADAARRESSSCSANHHTAPRRPKVLRPVRALTSAPVLSPESLLGLGLLVEVG